MANKAYINDGSKWINFPAGNKNRIINGGMDFAQRGTSITRGSSDGYTLDRWYASGYGSGQAFTIAQSSASPPLGFNYFQRTTQSTANSTNCFITQSLEVGEVLPLRGSEITVSFYYRNVLNHTNTWIANVHYSTTSNVNLAHSGVTRTNLGTKTLQNSTQWVQESITVTVPSNASSLCIEFVNVNSTVINAQFDITGVQLETGSVITQFDRKNYQEEFLLCQRYYQYVYGISHGSFDTSYSVEGMVIGFNQMRTTPTVIYYDWVKHGHISGNTNYLPANYTMEVSTASMSLWWNTASAAYRGTGYRGAIGAYLQAEL